MRIGMVTAIALVTAAHCANAGAQSAITVMPLGDSITAGYDGVVQASYPGYRENLLSSLNSEGYSVQYIGANAAGLCPELTAIGQNAENGYSGYDSLSILENIDGDAPATYSTTSNLGGYWLTGGPAGNAPAYPNIVLLIVGTNDPGQGIGLGTPTTRFTTEGDIAAILNWFTVNRPGTVVIVGTPPQSAQPAITAVSDAEASWLPGYLAANDPQDLFVNVSSAVPLADISADGVHPNANGYAIIASLFNTAIESVTAAPLTQRFVSTASSSTFAAASNWSPQATPGSASNLSIMNSGSPLKTINVSTSTVVEQMDLQGAVDLEIQNGVDFATPGQLIVDTGATLNVRSGGSVIAYGGLAGAGSTTVFPGASLSAVSLRQASLTIDSTVKVSLAPPHDQSETLSILGGLTISGSTDNWTGQLDLGNSDLDIQSGGLATVVNQIKQGYAGGTWTGRGITASSAAADTTHLTALGAILNNDGLGNPIFGSGTTLGLFDGVNPGTGDVLVKFTYYGDTNLDGKIDGSDYSRIDAAYGTALTGWFNGDFNYDNVVDGSDYALIDNAFNQQGAQTTAALATAQIGGTSAVPEPATFALLGLAAMSQLARRRRYTRVASGVTPPSPALEAGSFGYGAPALRTETFIPPLHCLNSSE